jgi:hypothetical protein
VFLNLAGLHVELAGGKLTEEQYVQQLAVRLEDIAIEAERCKLSSISAATYQLMDIYLRPGASTAVICGVGRCLARRWR